MSKEVTTTAPTPPASPSKPVSKAGVMRSWLEQARPQIAMALPKHLTPDRMFRVAMTAIQRTPKLLDCDPTSVVGAVVLASQLGLEPDGVLGQGYLIPRWNRNTGKDEATFQVGYKGLIALARRSGEVERLTAKIVYAKDTFEYEDGINLVLRHKPFLDGDRGAPVLVYGLCQFKDGGYEIEVMTVADVEAVRARSQSAKSGPWVTDWAQMARKTVIKRMANYLPLSVEFQRAATLDSALDTGDMTAADVAIEVDSTGDGTAPTIAEVASAATQSALRDKYAQDVPKE